MKILFIGISVRAMAESALRSGYSLVALDAFGDLDLQSLCESYSLARGFGLKYSPAALMMASQKLNFDEMAYTSNLENYPAVVSSFAERCRVLGNSPEVLRRIRKWPYLFGILASAGYRTPVTLYAGNGQRPGPERRWLVKPVHSGGGLRVNFWEKDDLPRRGYILQEYVSGPPLSASFLANGREAVVIGLTEQLIGQSEFGASGFRYCGNLLPPLQTEPAMAREVFAQVQDIANLLTRQFGLVGVNGMDFILSGRDVCLTEVNPRFSASMEIIERAYGLPVFDLHVQAVTRGDLPDFNLLSTGWPEGQFHAKAILYAEKTCQAPDTRNWMNRGVRDVPAPGEQFIRGNPVCTVLASGPTRETCLANLITETTAMKGELYA